jgi:phosphohistidine phosphatase SixA
MSEGLRLTLLRHAHADPQAAGGDRERTLSLRGEAEADAAARWLAQHGMPARVLTSDAARTRQTAARVLAQIGYVDQRVEASIYEADVRDLIAVVEAHADAGHLLLVGHNPSLESLVAMLTTGQSGDHRGMPPAGIAVLDFPSREIEPGTATLVAFWSP